MHFSLHRSRSRRIGGYVLLPAWVLVQYLHANPHSHSKLNANSLFDADHHAEPHRYANSHRNPDPHTDVDTEPHADAHSHTNRDGSV